MSYATVAQLRKYLKQVPAGVGFDAELQDVLDAATGIIDEVLGYSYDDVWGSVPSFDTFIAPFPASVYLKVPNFKAASTDYVSETEDDVEITNWREHGTMALVRTVAPYTSAACRPVWVPEETYTVRAIWGYGPAPAAIVEVCRQIAVNLFHSGAASRFTGGALVGAGNATIDPQGQKGGGRKYADFLTPAQEAIILGQKSKYTRLVM